MITFEQSKDQVAVKYRWSSFNEIVKHKNSEQLQIAIIQEAAELYAQSKVLEFSDHVYKGYYVHKIDLEDILERTNEWITKTKI